MGAMILRPDFSDLRGNTAAGPKTRSSKISEVRGRPQARPRSDWCRQRPLALAGRVFKQQGVPATGPSSASGYSSPAFR